MKCDIILCGVGGQGILSIATIIGQAAMDENLYIKQAEVHGMSQRGGDVQSNLRISSEPIASDLIAKGRADVIISMEPMEALRYLPYLATDGWVITSTAPFVNIPNYPDTARLLDTLRALRQRGNTVVVVEHDPEVIRAADWIVDMGPGGGKDGGRIVATGTPTEIKSCPQSVTGRYI